MNFLPKKTLSVCLFHLLLLKSSQSLAISSYGIGYGMGKTNIEGRSQSINKKNVLSAELDVNNDNSFAYLGTTLASNGEFTNTRLIVGGGTSFFKVGSGIVYMNTHFNTNAQSWGLFNSNPRLQTEVSITGVPLYFRWTPLSTDKWNIYLDAYYMIAAQGELKIPVAGTGLSSANIVLRTNTLKVENPHGYGITVNYKVTNDFGLQFNYFEETGRIVDSYAIIPGDPLSALSPTYIEGFGLTNQTMTLSLTLLIE